MAITQRNVKHSKIKLKNWFVLAISVALFEKMITPPDPITLVVLTTDALPVTLIMINA